MVPLEQRQNVGIQHEETHTAPGSSRGVVFDFPAVLGHRLHPVLNPRIVLEHASELHPRVLLRADLERHQFRPFLEAGLDFCPQLRQRLLARGALGADSEGLRAARPLAVALDLLHDNRNLHGEPPKGRDISLLAGLRRSS